MPAKGAKAVMRAATALLHCNQPRRSVGDLRCVLQLTEGHAAAAEEGAERDELIGALLSVLDVRERPLRCRRCQTRFVRCEFNRDGHEYRCPACNTFTAPGGGSGGSAAEAPDEGDERPVPRGEVRHVEAIANDVFGEYTRLYYGRDALCSAYVWSLGAVAATDDEGADADADADADAPMCLGFAFFVSNELPGADEGAGAGSVWHSAHVLKITEAAGGGASYVMQSKVYLDVGIGGSGAPVEGVEKNKDGGQQQQRFNGFVTRRSTFCAPSSLTVTPGSRARHVTAIGAEVQRVEGSLRDSLLEIYFSKAAQVLSKLRPSFAAVTGEREGVTEEWSTRTGVVEGGGGGPRRHRMLLAAADDRDGGADGGGGGGPGGGEEAHEEPAVWAAVAPEKDGGAVEAEVVQKHTKKPKKSKKSVWSELVDDEGNTYYYNKKTGETSWELPREADVAEAGRHGDAAVCADEGTLAPAAAPEPIASPSADADAATSELEETLTGLGLTQPVDAYLEALSSSPWGSIDTVSMLLELTQWDVPEGATAAPVETLFPVFGDRRKLLKWAARTLRAQRQGDEA